MEVVPLSVGVVARAWDEEHLSLLAAAGGLGDAEAGAFTPCVAAAAAEFCARWADATAALAESCETRADSLRRVLAAFVATDEVAAWQFKLLLGLVQERR